MRNHPQVLANGHIVEIDTPHWGRMHVDGLPWKFERTPAGPIRAGGKPGEHTAEVLAELGIVDDRRRGRIEVSNAGSLDGFRVIDFTQGLCGPFCTMQLGDAGAEVIKIEPPAGDFARRMGPPFVGEESAVFLSLNRNKKSVVLDLESAERPRDGGAAGARGRCGRRRFRARRG